MPRRRVAERREVLPDPIYNSPLVTKFINGVMWQGKKSLAENIFYGAMQQIGDKTGEEPLKVFKRAIDNVKPTVEVKSRRVGVRPTRCRLKFIRNEEEHWRFAGSFPTLEVGAKRR